MIETDPVQPFTIQKFLGKYPGLIWSNHSPEEEAVVRTVLRSGLFTPILDLCLLLGHRRISESWQDLRTELALSIQRKAQIQEYLNIIEDAYGQTS
jgi:hypothetical protein